MESGQLEVQENRSFVVKKIANPATRHLDG